MNKIIREVLPFASLIVIIGILAVLRPEDFLTVDNFLNVLRRSSVLGIMAVGMTFVIVSAGIDLSVGSMSALCGMIGVGAMLLTGGENPGGASLVFGTVAGMLCGGVCGLVNGLAISRFNLPPFIVTLGSMSLFRGITLVMNNGQPYNVPGFAWLGAGKLAGVPVSVILLFAAMGLGMFLLNYTRPGRYTYAIGSNEEAAFYAGINVKGYKLFIYTFSGLLVGLAAMIAVSRTISAQPTAGTGAELDVIAAVVIGGASLSGGRGTITGTIIGTFLIQFLRNGCTLIGISTNAQLIVIGLVIVLAVAVDQLARTKARA
jgi:ribose/xylose/arabinose/galactoside ABC-type transport system permease subunit